MRECKAGTRRNITTFEGYNIDVAASQFSLSQVIKEPTNILSNLAFTLT